VKAIDVSPLQNQAKGFDQRTPFTRRGEGNVASRGGTTQASLRLQALRPHTVRALGFGEHSADFPARPPFHRLRKLGLPSVAGPDFFTRFLD
jgi:hypothetical protein